MTRQEEKQSAAIRNLEIELATTRRNAVVFEGERTSLQKRVEELTSQNQELAKVFSAQRGRMLERESTMRLSEEDGSSGGDRNTPEHSPPPSPMKMPPARHSALESETLKTSLGHAQRTIQTLRTNIHREKTEKLELKRMLQDARDEIEKLRTDPQPAPKKNRKVESREGKKPAFKVNQLGGVRPSRIEVVEDPDWEDQSEAPSPQAMPFRNDALRSRHFAPLHESSSDQFDTANETADDAAFETAREETRGTETEDFQTGVEDFSSDEGTATETDRRPFQGPDSIKRPPPLPAGQSTYSLDSTASTSSDDDEYGFTDMRSPSAHPAQRMRVRRSRGSLGRRSRQFREEPSLQSSPASPAPATNGRNISMTTQQSLFAELNDLENSDEDSYVGTSTPSRRSIRSVTPATPGSVVHRAHLSPAPDVPRLPKIVMVDRGIMTEPVAIRELADAAEARRAASDDEEDARSSVPSVICHERPRTMESVIAPRTSTPWLGEELRAGQPARPMSVMSYSDASVQHESDVEGKLAPFPSPPSSPSHRRLIPTAILAPPPPLSLSSIHAEDIEPRAEPAALPTPPSLSISSILSTDTEPVSESALPPQQLVLSAVMCEQVEPLAPVPPTLGAPVIATQETVPVAEPEPTPVALAFSTVAVQEIEPLTATPAPLSLSTIHAEHVEPIEPLPAALSFSAIHASQDAEPIPEPEPAVLGFSRIHASHDLEPVPEPKPAPLRLSTIHATHDLEPIPEPAPSPRALVFSDMQTEQVAPAAEPETEPVTLVFSAIRAEDVEPVSELVAAPAAPALVSVAAMVAEGVRPAEAVEPAERSAAAAVIPRSVEPTAEIPVSPPLSFSSIVSEQVEPSQEAEATAPVLTFAPVHPYLDVPPSEAPLPTLSLSSVVPCLDVQPVEVALPALSLSTVRSQDVEPLEAPPPALSLSSVQSQAVEPREAPQPPLSLASICVWDVEPAEVPVVPPPTLSLASIQSQAVEPLEGPALPAPALSLSVVQTQAVEPVVSEVPKLSISLVESQAVEPVVSESHMLSVSGIESQAIEPVMPEESKLALPPLALSAIQAWQTEPVEGRGPKRHAFMVPRGTVENDINTEQQQPWEDTEPAKKQPALTADQGVQTTLTSEATDQPLKAKTEPLATDRERSHSYVSIGTPSTVRIHRPGQESLENGTRPRDQAVGVEAEALDHDLVRNPGSSASIRSAFDHVPPLPANHKEVIEAARSGSSHGGQGSINSMPPPLFPASALRPRTPTSARRPLSPVLAAGRVAPTPRAVHQSESIRELAEMRSTSRLTAHSRKSSISSFASEVDTRFNTDPDGGFDTHGLGPNTDPRMIQAITQTMIGEYLWKYTRKAGRGEMSENRHRRYFWVHPYTRTLYWSDRDPSSAGGKELRAKSVPIEAVRVVSDDNPMPPGLHRKSLVIVSPGRTVKFTCTTGQRHETWFNALSYLLLRTTKEGPSDAEEVAGHITREDVDEFNPTYGRQMPNGSRGAPSLSSYNSRTARESPTTNNYLDVPTLTPSRSKVSVAQTQQPARSSGTLSRISGYWKDSRVLSGTFGSIRSRSVSGRDTPHSIYEAGEVQDSAEDLREMMERQDRESDRLENVRACCDG
ncbi:AMI1 protein, partial [Podospora australis]